MVSLKVVVNACPYSTATARVSSHVHSTCTSYVLYAYLYCVYVLVGGAISSAVHESVTTNCTLSSTGPLSAEASEVI